MASRRADGTADGDHGGISRCSRWRCHPSEPVRPAGPLDWSCSRALGEARR
jgi:hypothetical protein